MTERVRLFPDDRRAAARRALRESGGRSRVEPDATVVERDDGSAAVAVVRGRDEALPEKIAEIVEDLRTFAETGSRTIARGDAAEYAERLSRFARTVGAPGAA